MCPNFDTLLSLRHSRFTHFLECRCYRHSTKITKYYSKAETISQLTIHSKLLLLFTCEYSYFVNYEVRVGWPKLGHPTLSQFYCSTTAQLSSLTKWNLLSPTISIWCFKNCVGTQLGCWDNQKSWANFETNKKWEKYTLIYIIGVERYKPKHISKVLRTIHPYIQCAPHFVPISNVFIDWRFSCHVQYTLIYVKGFDEYWFWAAFCKILTPWLIWTNLSVLFKFHPITTWIVFCFM